MQKHHRAWLAAHPDRSEAWFKERMADGFHIHHVDGDRKNNSPDNLVMIEGVDHMGIHKGPARHTYRHSPIKPDKYHIIPKGKPGVYIIN